MYAGGGTAGGTAFADYTFALDSDRSLLMSVRQVTDSALNSLIQWTRSIDVGSGSGSGSFNRTDIYDTVHATTPTDDRLHQPNDGPGPRRGVKELRYLLLVILLAAAPTLPLNFAALSQFEADRFLDLDRGY